MYRNDNLIDKISFTTPETVSFTYPASLEDYTSFAFTGSDVVLSWEPDSATNLVEVTYRFFSRLDGEAGFCEGGKVLDVILQGEAIEKLNGALVIPAEQLGRCPSPVGIQATFGYAYQATQAVISDRSGEALDFSVDVEQIIYLNEAK